MNSTKRAFRFPLSHRLLFRRRETRQRSGGEGQGQAVVLLAVAGVVLLVFVGLVTDVGMLYLTYGQLKRAVDAAAVAAAGNFKRGESLSRITEAAREMTALHNVEQSELDLDVFICDTDGDGLRDDVDPDGVPPWTGLPPNFWAQCPDTGAGEAPRKLIWVDATQKAPVYFLQLVGTQSVALNTNAIAEAATVDVVIVLDVSESMGSDTVCNPNCTPGYTNPSDFDPSACNTANNCYPLRDAKDAAKALVATLYDGYDQVAVVTFDYFAREEFPLSLNLGDDDSAADGDAYAAIDAIQLHDDAPGFKFANPPGRLWWNRGDFNPVNPEDRDGDGLDVDPLLPCTDNNDDHYDDADPSLPCDQDNVMDAFDWDLDGCPYPDPGVCPPTGDPDPLNPNPDLDDDALGRAYVTLWGHPEAPMSSCLGCGMRTGTEVLMASGRPNGVWVIIFLSDGLPNMSDLPAVDPCLPVLQSGGTCVTPTHGIYHTPAINTDYTNGFCGGGLQAVFWSDLCVDWQPDAPRYCIDDPDSTTCPPGATYAPDLGGPGPFSPPYSVEDYTRDMTDFAGLLISGNPDEPRGSDIAIYSIALGAASAREAALGLRYMANVGDDGDRATAPCPYAAPFTTNCGQYYYAPTGPALTPIFEDIASRIFTRLTQ